MIYLLLINIVLTIFVECKQFKRCQLARELYWRHKIPEKDLPVWLCITYKSSRYNTDTIDTKKGNYGMFQINKQFCFESSDEQLENIEKLCKVPCEAFVDYDIKDDIECVKKIFNEAKYFLGNGFLGWELYKKCKGPRSKLYIKGCNYRKPPKRKINTQKIDKELTTIKSFLSTDKNISENIKQNKTKTDINLELNTTEKLNLFEIYPAGHEGTFLVSRNNLSIICSKLFTEKSIPIIQNTSKVYLTEINIMDVNITENPLNVNNTTEGLNLELTNTNTTEQLLQPPEIISLQNKLDNNSLEFSTDKTNFTSNIVNITEQVKKNDIEYQTENGVKTKLLFVFNWLYNQLMNI